MIKNFGFIKVRELIKWYTFAYKISKLHVTRKPPNMKISEDATLHMTGYGMQVKKKHTHTHTHTHSKRKWGHRPTWAPKTNLTEKNKCHFVFTSYLSIKLITFFPYFMWPLVYLQKWTQPIVRLHPQMHPVKYVQFNTRFYHVLRILFLWFPKQTHSKLLSAT
jgi:hypothetical protein